MKKLKLKALELGAMEVLTRAQLKSIMGGDGCTSDADCPPSAYCSNSNGNVCVDRGGSYIIGGSGSGSGSGDGGGNPFQCYYYNCENGIYCATTAPSGGINCVTGGKCQC